MQDMRKAQLRALEASNCIVITRSNSVEKGKENLIFKPCGTLSSLTNHYLGELTIYIMYFVISAHSGDNSLH